LYVFGLLALFSEVWSCGWVSRSIQLPDQTLEIITLEEHAMAVTLAPFEK
jgi:hypothetical protein